MIPPLKLPRGSLCACVSSALPNRNLNFTELGVQANKRVHHLTLHRPPASARFSIQDTLFETVLLDIHYTHGDSGNTPCSRRIDALGLVLSPRADVPARCECRKQAEMTFTLHRLDALKNPTSIQQLSRQQGLIHV